MNIYTYNSCGDLKCCLKGKQLKQRKALRSLPHLDLRALTDAALELRTRNTGLLYFAVFLKMKGDVVLWSGCGSHPMKCQSSVELDARSATHSWRHAVSGRAWLDQHANILSRNLHSLQLINNNTMNSFCRKDTSCAGLCTVTVIILPHNITS